MFKRLLYISFLASLLVSGIITSILQNNYFEQSIQQIFNDDNISLFISPALAEDEREDGIDEDQYCSQRLLGTMSEEKCKEVCINDPMYVCALAHSYPEDQDPKLEEDVDCYGCKKLTCPDFGRLDNFGRNACDARVGWFSEPDLPLPDGSPCWKCSKQVDQCNTKWPGSSWLTTCRAGCKGKDKKCVQVGIHQGRGCFQCQKIPVPKTCKEIDKNFITKGQCDATCKDPTPICQWTGDVAGNGELCYTCAPKKKINDPDEDDDDDPDLTCEQINPKAHTPPCDCGKGYPVSVQLRGKDCCVCLEDECSPDLNVWDCMSQCENQGGLCYQLTRERNGPRCYGCRMPPKVPQTCEEIGRYSSCSPNPCDPAKEICIPDRYSDYDLDCFKCAPRWQHPPPDYCSPELEPNCTRCYAANHACTSVTKTLLSGRDITCYKCEDPYTMKRCADYELDDGACEPDDPCKGREDGKTKCRTLQGNNFECHRCEEPPKYIQCEDGFIPGKCSGNYPCDFGETCVSDRSGDCHNCEFDEGEQYCEDFGYEQSPCASGYECEKVDSSLVGGLDNCCLCKKLPEPPPKCDDGLRDGPCGAYSCPTGFKCNPVGNDCHECVPKNCEELGFSPITGCPTGQECAPIMTFDGLECCDCFAIDCAYYDLDNKAACEAECAGDQTRECKPTSTAPSGEQCFQCLTKDDYICDPQKGQYMSGSNCNGQCDKQTQWCLPISGNDYGCLQCVNKPLPKGCADLDLPNSCPDDQVCEGTIAPNGEQCCEHCRAKNCKEIGKRPRSEACENCGRGRSRSSCVEDVIAPNGQQCWKCESYGSDGYPPPMNPCLLELINPGHCQGDCRPEESCTDVVIDNTQCHWCGDKDPLAPCAYHAGEGRCPAVCSANQYCTQSSDQDKECYDCRNKTCRDLHKAESCDHMECPDGFECRPIEMNEGQFCADCFKVDGMTNPCAEKGWVMSCDLCDHGETCDQNNPITLDGVKCYRCTTEESQCSQYSNYPRKVFDNCNPDPCDKGFNCIPYEPEKGVRCAQCIWAGDDECPNDFPSPGACPGLCDYGQICENTDGPCHRCRDYDDVVKECSDGFYPQKCQSDADCDRGQYCEKDPNNNLCSACYNKPQSCEDVGLKSSCAADEVCDPASDPRLNADCCNCRKKSCEDYEQSSEEPECRQGYHPESSGFSAPNGEKCFWCAPNTCEQEGFAPINGCPTGQECSPVSTRAGKECCSCFTPVPPKCEDVAGQFSRGRNCGGTCDSNQECKPIEGNDFGCEHCQNKPVVKKNCHELDKLEAEDCRTCLSYGGKCVDDGVDDNGIRCFKCEKDPENNKCEDGYMAGACSPVTCADGFSCSDVTMHGEKCHACIKNEETMCPHPWVSGGCNPNPCAESAFPDCTPYTASGSSMDQYLTGKCHQCKPSFVSECPQGSSKDNNCGGLCDMGYYCAPTEGNQDCWACKKDKCYFSQYQSGSCPSPDPCLPDAECKNASAGDQQCHYCQSLPPREDPPPQCDPPYEPGLCPESCPKDQCRTKSITTTQFGLQFCHYCEPKELRLCPEPTFLMNGCYGCRAEGGKCVAANFDEFDLRQSRPLIQCFKCEYPESCEKYDYFSDCGECYEDEACVAAPKMVKNTLTGRVYQCVDCIPEDFIEYIEYIIIIIETPTKRYVLKKDGDESYIESKAVMALVKVDPSGKIQNAAGQLKDLKDIIKGSFGPLGMINAGKVNASQLTDFLSKGLQDRGSFGQDCFNDLAQDAEPAFPTPKGKPKKGELYNKEEPPKDDSGGAAITGPIVSCGEKDGEKVISIYDATGALVDSITPKMLKDDSNAVIKAFKKAEELSQKFTQIKRPSISGLIKKFSGLPVANVERMLKQIPPQDKESKQYRKKMNKIIKNFEDGELIANEDVVPNDPLYVAPTLEKKKKMLDFLGGSGSAKTVMGSGMRMGGRVLGAGAAGLGDQNNSDIEDQYALEVIGFTPMTDPDSAWNVVDVYQKNVIVAVIDSGLDFSHPDAPKYIWVNKNEIPDNGIDDDGNGFIDDIHGWNFLNDNHDFTDYCGHGTFVTGIIAANTNNGIGIAGINPGAVIMPIKVTNEDGETDSFQIYRGIMYAVNQGAKVINISLGGRGISALEQSAINHAHQQGVFVAVASGNVGEEISLHGPASSKYVTAVGAMDYEGTISVISNWGSNNGLLTPGEEIYSLTSKDNKHVKPSVREFGYHKESGTSFSTPMVTATASLIFAKNPSLTVEQVEDILFSTATDLEDEGWDGKSGAGLLNAQQAIRKADAKGDVTVKFTEVRQNKDYNKKIESVDVFATVRGSIKSYVLEVGKGKRPGNFEKIAGPFSKEINYQLLYRIMADENLRGSDDWVLKIIVTDQQGQTKEAVIPLELD